jgi:hypothetical protein
MRTDDSPDDRLLRIEANIEITQLAYRYALAVDTRDPGLMLSLFTDVGVDFPSPTLGYREIKTYADARWGDLEESILLVANHIIDYAGEQASGSVYCLAKFGQQSRWNEQAIRYEDRYARTEGGWRFVSRRHSLWYGEVQESNPMMQAPADWPRSQTGRGTLPYEWPLWRQATGYRGGHA